MRVLIVYAHPEPASFNAAMKDAAVATLEQSGHEVRVSDLYAMGFDPVSDRRNFTTVADPRRLQLQAEEAYAGLHGGFVPPLQAEIRRLADCDLLIFQFPLWWLGLPAILKGWIDRVFAAGQAYGGGRWFEGGVFAGRRAMCAVTAGGPPEVYAESARYAPIGQVLFPLHRGVFAFTGFSVLEPFVVYGPGRIGADGRARELRRYRERLLRIDTEPGLAPVGGRFMAASLHR